MQTEESKEVKELSQEEIRKALTAMHHGLLNMQGRLDDHEKVIEKLLLVMQELTAGKVPDGFRQPPAHQFMGESARYIVLTFINRVSTPPFKDKAS